MTDIQKIIIAGSRGITTTDALDAVMAQLTAGGPTRGRYEIITGGAKGVDQSGRAWAERYDCEYTEFPADWDTHGTAAGPIRNSEMARYAAPDGLLVAVWDGESRGTKDMIDKALSQGLDVHVRQP